MKTIKSFFASVTIVLLLLVLVCSPVIAQTPEAPMYRLNINRDFGYGAGADIRGLFSLKIVGPDDLTSVSYFIDGELMSAETSSPYTYQFNTSQFGFGPHELTAEVTNTAGKVFTTPARHMNFVSSEQESAGMAKIVGPLLLLMVGVFLIVGLAQFAGLRKRNPNGIPLGTQRNYGFAGGSICKYCGRPTPRHIWGLNIVIGKFDRCENCGKWSIMQAAPMEILRAAEEAEKAGAFEKPSFNEKTEEEQLRELIDKSKYE